MPYFLKRISPLFLLFLAACSSDPFPDCCIGTDARRDAPFTTTYLFQFKTGAGNIPPSNTESFLRIITEADILTLKNAAATSQLNRNGLIGGVVRGLEGPARETDLRVTDAEGNLVGYAIGPRRNLFYNSLGRVPDLTIDRGTSTEGTFTLFNAPPGEIFFQAVRGGRGSGRITSFPASVSIGRIDILPVLPDEIGLLAVVNNAAGGAAVPGAVVSIYGREKTETANGAGLILIPPDQGIPTHGDYLIRIAAPGFRETSHRFRTDMSAVLSRQQAFDPLTDDNSFIYSEETLRGWARTPGIDVNLLPTTGVITGRLTPTQPDATVTPFDLDGNPLGRAFYFDLGNKLDPSQNGTTSLSTFIIFVDCDGKKDRPIFLHASSLSLDNQNNTIRSTGRAVADCRPGGVFYQTIPISARSKEGKSFTVPIENGEVKPEGGGAPIGGATIKVIGGGETVYTADSAGRFTIPAGPPDALLPLPANSLVTIRAEASGHLPTYQSLQTGPSGGKRDLFLLPEARMAQICPPSGRGSLFGTVLDLGLVDLSKQGRPADEISLKVFTETGGEIGRVVYLDPAGNPAPERTVTSRLGQFAVCDLPLPPTGPGLFQIRVVSPEDSGLFMASVYPDGVTRLLLDVNKALPREVSFQGALQNFVDGSPVGEMHLSFLGTERRQTADPSGRFELPLDSNGRFIVRAEKEGYLPSYNDQIETNAKRGTIAPVPIYTLAEDDLPNLLQQAGLPPPLQGGLLAGTAQIRGFDPPVPLSLGGSLNTPVQQLHFGLFDDDPPVDLLSLSEQGTWTFLQGDGNGNFRIVAQSPLTYRKTATDPPQILSSVKSSVVRNFDSDNQPDLVVLGDDRLIFFQGNRTTQFDEGREIPLPAADPPKRPKTLSVAELDGDGSPDLAVAVTGNQPLLRLINQTDGNFLPFKSTTNLTDPSGGCGTDPTAMIVRQARSSIVDILIVDLEEGLCDLTFNAEGSPLSPIPLKLPEGVSPAEVIGIETAFLDADNLPDFLLLHKKGGAFFLGPPPTQIQDAPTTSITFQPSFELDPLFDPSRIALTDVNRDRRLDLIVAGRGGLLLFTGNGGATFGSPAAVSSSPLSEVALGDADDDGVDDLILASLDGSLQRARGSARPRGGVRVEARNAAGELVGRVAYPDPDGVIRNASATTDTGRFILFNVPEGFAHLSAVEGGSGNALVTLYPGGLSYTPLNINPIPPPTILLEGQVINPTAGELAGISVEEIKINAVGTTAKTVSGTDGKYQLHLGANSEHILRMDP